MMEIIFVDVFLLNKVDCGLCSILMCCRFGRLVICVVECEWYMLLMNIFMDGLILVLFVLLLNLWMMKLVLVDDCNWLICRDGMMDCRLLRFWILVFLMILLLIIEIVIGMFCRVCLCLVVVMVIVFRCLVLLFVLFCVVVVRLVFVIKVVKLMDIERVVFSLKWLVVDEFILCFLV